MPASILSRKHPGYLRHHKADFHHRSQSEKHASLSAATTISHSSLKFGPAVWAGPAMLFYAVRCAREGGNGKYHCLVDHQHRGGDTDPPARDAPFLSDQAR
jgi:hypothetical protein